MKQYQVTLNFAFLTNVVDDENNEKAEAFHRTDKYFEKHSVMNHIKSYNAFDMVMNLVCDGEVISAKWDKKKFAIHMIVDTNLDEEGLREDLKLNPLEDGEYESSGDTAWVVMTRCHKGEEDSWEYGLTDYRQNPIEIQFMGEKPVIPDCKELFILTEKGKDIYRQITEARKKGMKFDEEDEKKFWVMRESC